VGKVAKSEGEPRELVPAGNYLGVICGVYDLGTQSGGQYGPKPQILVQWELHKRRGPARDAKSNILTISNFYTLSFGDKANLRKDVEAMLGKTFSEEEAKAGYDIEDLLGKACRLQIVHEPKQGGGTRDQIGAIMALDDDDDAPRGELSEAYFEIKEGDRTIPETVPEWIKKLIHRSKEFGGGNPVNGRPAARQPVGATAGGDDDIPF
jgi:hypothetical protein